MNIATFNKQEMDTLKGYSLSDVLVKGEVMRLVFTNPGCTKAASVDILCDPEGNGPGFASVFHV